MRLYHFTSLAHLPRIMADGVIKTTESNVGSPSLAIPPAGDHYAADVVWLLDTPHVDYNHGLKSDGQVQLLYPKTDVRITVELEDAVPWLRWKPKDEMHSIWRKTMIKTGGGSKAVKHWWVVERVVPTSEWREVRTPEGVVHFSTK